MHVSPSPFDGHMRMRIRIRVEMITDETKI